MFLTLCPNRHPAATVDRNFSTPLLQRFLLGQHLQTLFHFGHLPICQMSPMQAKGDIWSLGYYLTGMVWRARRGEVWHLPIMSLPFCYASYLLKSTHSISGCFLLPLHLSRCRCLHSRAVMGGMGNLL